MSELETGAVIGFVVREGWKWLWLGLEWAIEYRAARAESDGVTDWQDLFWPRLLARVSKERHRRLAAEKSE